MDELISRRAAIDALARMMPRSYTPDGSHPADEEIFRAQEVFADCIEVLEILPSAQPEPRWIPVEDKERLPRDGQRVLITDEDGEIDIAHIIDYSDIGEGIEWWSHDYKCNPIAWSELPKPYERSEE